MLIYEVIFGSLTDATLNGSVKRTETKMVGATAVTSERTVINVVGPQPTNSTTSLPIPAFTQNLTPLRTLDIDIPIRSAQGGKFDIVTTIAGRNSWRTC